MKLKFALMGSMRMVTVTDLIVAITLFDDEDLDDISLEALEALRELLTNLLSNIEIQLSHRKEQ